MTDQTRFWHLHCRSQADIYLNKIFSRSSQPQGALFNYGDPQEHHGLVRNVVSLHQTISQAQTYMRNQA
jgi:hypothetical protein